MKPTYYYIEWPGHPTNQDLPKNQLGKIEYPVHSLGDGKVTRRHIFYPSEGWNILVKLINDDSKSKLLQYVKILSSSGRTYTIDRFFLILENVELAK